ncbi:hypothetical protein NDU88_006764 [Pleurodeles waltl]|uniref:Secreted protein n=1 Tax=Pleurodeles waltl TaxID=8319 RepID=A0AAV7L6B2_PLEWA|nr:hypothetical protein NDU88_006764 [Pleurodeles waltl]
MPFFYLLWLAEALEWTCCDRSRLYRRPVVFLFYKTSTAIKIVLRRSNLSRGLFRCSIAAASQSSPSSVSLLCGSRDCGPLTHASGDAARRQAVRRRSAASRVCPVRRSR